MTIGKKIAIILIGLGFLISGVLSADPAGLITADRRMPPDAPGGGLEMLARLQTESIFQSAVQELTGETPEDIQNHLQAHTLHAFLDEQAVNPDALHQLIYDKTITKVNQYYSLGLITQDQHQQILTSLKKREERTSILNLMIKKCLDDGTITSEQADIVMDKP